MIDLYAAKTGNGLRACVAMAECALEHTVHPVDLSTGEHKTPEFLKMNPLGSIPVMIDHDGGGGKPLTLCQSAAIVIYAAEKSGKFLPDAGQERALALQWLMLAASDVAGTNNAIYVSTILVPEKVSATIEVFEDRLYGFFCAVDESLGHANYLAGDVSVADLALYPFVALRQPLLDTRETLPNLKRWADRMAARDGVVKGMNAID